MDQATALRERFGRHSVDYYYKENMEELPVDEKRYKASELMPNICTHWKAMSEEEQEAATADGIQSIIEQWEMKGYPIHNTMISMEFIWLGGFVLPGSKICLVKTHVEEVLNLKKKLKTAAAPVQVSRMYYTNFNSIITSMYHVVLENWPLSKFCCPGDINSRNELRVLHHAWNMGTTHFQKLTEAEFEEWESERFQAVLANNSNFKCEDDDVPTLLPNTETPTPPLESPTAAPVLLPAPSQPNPATQGTKHSSDVMTVVFATSGEGISIQKKARKEWSDKGRKRGPRKDRAAAPGDA
ncbi:hypothetical protein BDR07DRAFT_1375131 [Suillus spraguei]|nr:hypothetical protein BDR07DRAFT_1375131 [Suillus spraguei]